MPSVPLQQKTYFVSLPYVKSLHTDTGLLCIVDQEGARVLLVERERGNWRKVGEKLS